MDIFGIGWLELLFILIIAMIIVGPRDLGKAGRQIGHFLNQMYKSESWRMLNEASRNLRNLPNRLAREAALEELDGVSDALKDTGKEIRGEMQDFNNSLKAWTPTIAPPENKPSATPNEGSSEPPQGEKA
ncbi:MAG: hypothetical protein MUP44_09015 [Anaerolineales bacterium]|nr:hypothetical protein [Anaerolineales bacterium]